MKRVGSHELEIELWWRQTGPDEWVVRIRDRRTGQQAEARSETELRQALERLRDGAGRRGDPGQGETADENRASEAEEGAA
jgi:hypothetical protein